MHISAMASDSAAPTPPTPPAAETERVRRHTLFEDAQALFTGTLFVSLALIMFRQAGLMTGGTAGAAFLLHYATGLSFGPLFFVLNLPFYGFAWKRMGLAFTLKTFLSVGLLSLMTSWSPALFAIERLHPAYAAVLGGLLLGSGCLFLARHHASLGGATIVSLYLQRARQWRAGHVQMAIDGTILALSFALIEPQKALYSILAAVTMNLFIAINHRPGRYAVL